MATYYVDNQAFGASDSNTGSSSSPYLTLAKANNVAVSGDTVMVRNGTYRESTTCKSSGVTWQAAGQNVIIDGLVTYALTWSLVSGTIYSANVPLTTVPIVVWVNGTPYYFTATSAATVAGSLIPVALWVNNGFYYDTTTSTLYVDFMGVTPSTATVQLSQLPAAFVANNLTGLVFAGFKLRGSNGYGIRIQGGSGNTIRECEAWGHPSGGLRLEAPTPQLFLPSATAGGSLPAGTYGYVVTAMVGGIETMPSFERTVTTTSTGSLFVQWSRVVNATSYNVYGRTVGDEKLITSIADPGSGFVSWTDTGSLSPGIGTIPNQSAVTTSDCLIVECESHRNGSHGIYLYVASSNTVRANRSHHNAFHGIGVINYSNNNLVELNQCWSNWKGPRVANGIQCDNFAGTTRGSSNNVIQRNRVWSNEDSGISIYNGSANCIVRWNISYSNGDHGIDNFNSTNCRMINNTVYKNVTSGLNSEGTSTGIRMYNNISMDNGVQSPRTTGNYRIDNTANLDAQVDYNVSFLTVPATSQTTGSNGEFVWGTAGYSTMAQFTSAVPSQQLHGMSINPRFANLAARNFRPTSLNILGSGTSTAPDLDTTDFNGSVLNTPPDVGAQQIYQSVGA